MAQSHNPDEPYRSVYSNAPESHATNSMQLYSEFDSSLGALDDGPPSLGWTYTLPPLSSYTPPASSAPNPPETLSPTIKRPCASPYNVDRPVQPTPYQPLIPHKPSPLSSGSWHMNYVHNDQDTQLQEDSRAEFEAASAKQRARSRGLTAESLDEAEAVDSDEEHAEEEAEEDAGGNASSEDEGSQEDDIEYDEIISQVDKYKESQAAVSRPRDSDGAEVGGLNINEALTAISKQLLEAQAMEDTGSKKIKPQKRHRGPRRAVEPTGDIKLRLGKANEAFQEDNLDKAKQVVEEIIRINAETYEAWILLSSIFQERRQCQDALMALIVAAHLRPKHVESWYNCAEYALYSMGEVTDKMLRDAQFCYATAVRNVPSNMEARRRKADVLVLRGKYAAAATEYAYILKTMPHDLGIIRELAVLYIDLREYQTGADLYEEIFEHFRRNPEVEEDEDQVNWDDLYSYATLWGFLKEGDAALKEVKSIARWFLGREQEDFWDEVTDNDCEWDLYDSRRSGVPKYSPTSFPSTSYGLGLPIEIRVSLGKLRLGTNHYEEALRHFSWLYATDGSRESKVQSHSYLVLEVANLLTEMDKHQDALIFFRALKQIPGEMTAMALVQMGRCLIHEELNDEAESCLLLACEIDQSNIEARIELARFFERLDEAEQAFTYVNQVLELESISQPKIYRRRKGPAKSQAAAAGTKQGIEDQQFEEEEVAIAGQLQEKYLTLTRDTEKMRMGDPIAMSNWMESARLLTEDFRSCKSFYPWERKEFDGYSAEEKRDAQRSLQSDMTILSRRHAENIGANDQMGTPTQYRGIEFRDWLTLFSEYALCLARRGRSREAYDVCEAAIHAVIFCFSREDMFHLHICYCMCALLANDEETCVAIARWFMVSYQFTSDSYRMFTAVTRMCHSPVSWYNSGPTQKFILRQIKTMDYSLNDNSKREKFFKDKAGFTHRDDNGELVINKDYNVCLLMTYGYILATGTSFSYAMNYFYRAYALDPKNPMISLSIGLSYIQLGLKRQAENRQFSILQGLTFMHKYYEYRKNTDKFDEVQEAHYNLARVYHLLGLNHLAIPYYRKVLDGAEERGEDDSEEEITTDAAYNLQIIYSVVGNIELAEKITERWLVV